MPDTPELRSMVEAAAHAAEAGDYVSAEELLCEVARLQEASLGPFHPDLANTLNNLGVACEITGNPVDAERHFRRACAIAAAVLPPDHPFAATSRKNLVDFCAARGKAVDLRPEPSRREAPPPVVSGGRSRPLAIGALIAGVLIVTLMAAATWFRTSPAPDAEPTPTDVPRKITPKPDIAPTPPAGRQVREPSSKPPAAASRATSATAPQRLVVASAHLCRELPPAGRRRASGDYQCVPPSQPVSPGPLFFYTRVKSPTNTTVQHRWYRGSRLHQVVELRIRASPTDGYRTYSRDTIDRQDAGDWRVELRTSSGVVLHEERFVVR